MELENDSFGVRVLRTFDYKLESALKCTIMITMHAHPRQTDGHHGNSATIHSNARIAR